MEQNLPFDVNGLLVFGKVVESRSLSKAAVLLGMPKSTVSRKLTKLEADLGIKLLRKNTHQLTVTDLGQKVYDHAVTILAEANGVRALAEGSRHEPHGELKVAIPVTCIIIALFGAPLATSTQRGGAAYGIGVSLATTVTFLMLIQLTKAIGGKGLIPPDAAAWIPSAIFGTIGLVLMARVRT